MDTCISHRPEETEALGESWGREAQPGWLVGLGGDLGVGKTQLIRGLARGLGFTGRVQSPTFALINEYVGGRLALHHIDLYRLDTPRQMHAAGLVEYFERPEGVVAVEWFDKWMPEPFAAWRQAVEQEKTIDSAAMERVGGSHLRLVWMEDLGESERRIRYEDFGV